MLKIVTKIYGQRVQRFQNCDQHQRQRKGCDLPRIHFVANHLEELQLRRAAIQPGVRSEALVQLEQAAFRQELTAKRTPNVYDTVEAVTDLLHVDVFQLRPVQIIQTQGALFTIGAIQFGYFLDDRCAVWSIDDERSRRITSRIRAGRIVDNGFINHRFVVSGVVHFDE